MATEEEETQPDEAISDEQVAQLVAIGDLYGKLVEGKDLKEMTRPGVYQQATLVFTQSLWNKVKAGKYDMPMALAMAVAWGVYVAELGQTTLTDDTRMVN